MKNNSIIKQLLVLVGVLFISTAFYAVSFAAVTSAVFTKVIIKEKGDVSEKDTFKYWYSGIKLKIDSKPEVGDGRILISDGVTVTEQSKGSKQVARYPVKSKKEQPLTLADFLSEYKKILDLKPRKTGQEKINGLLCDIYVRDGNDTLAGGKFWISADANHIVMKRIFKMPPSIGGTMTIEVRDLKINPKIAASEFTLKGIKPVTKKSK